MLRMEIQNKIKDRRFKVWVKITAKGVNDIGRTHKWTGVGCMEFCPYLWKSEDAQKAVGEYNSTLSVGELTDIAKNNLVYDEVLEKTARDLMVTKFPVGKYKLKDDETKIEIFNSFVQLLNAWQRKRSRGTYKTDGIYEFEVEHFDEAPPTKGVDKFVGIIAFNGTEEDYGYNESFLSTPALNKLICQRRDFHNGINPEGEINPPKFFTCHIKLPSIRNPLEIKDRYSEDEDLPEMKRYLTFKLMGLTLTDAVEKFLMGVTDAGVYDLELTTQKKDLVSDLELGSVHIRNPYSSIWGTKKRS